MWLRLNLISKLDMLIKRNLLLIGIVVAFLIGAALVIASCTSKPQRVIVSDDDLLGKYETSDKVFERTEIGDMIVYWHQRMIDDAIVEGDYIVYQFDRNTKELLKERRHWRDDLPRHVTIKITKEQAESMVRGEVQFTQLYIISPESDVFPLKPPPQNPCWVVTSVDSGKMIVTIIDAVNGKTLGHGVTPPTT